MVRVAILRVVAVGVKLDSVGRRCGRRVGKLFNFVMHSCQCTIRRVAADFNSLKSKFLNCLVSKIRKKVILRRFAFGVLVHDEVW